jgi:hypothetical protein
MTKKTVKIALGLSLAGALALAPTAASAAMAYDTGNVSCTYGYTGAVKTYAIRDVDGWAPGGAQYSWDWGKNTWAYHTKAGTSNVGSWLAESSVALDVGYTKAYCG